jgi:hypothetical protein
MALQIARRSSNVNLTRGDQLFATALAVQCLGCVGGLQVDGAFSGCMSQTLHLTLRISDGVCGGLVNCYGALQAGLSLFKLKGSSRRVDKRERGPCRHVVSFADHDRRKLPADWRSDGQGAPWQLYFAAGDQA